MKRQSNTKTVISPEAFDKMNSSQKLALLNKKDLKIPFNRLESSELIKQFKSNPSSKYKDAPNRSMQTAMLAKSLIGGTLKER